MKLTISGSYDNCVIHFLLNISGMCSKTQDKEEEGAGREDGEQKSAAMEGVSGQQIARREQDWVGEPYKGRKYTWRQ